MMEIGLGDAPLGVETTEEVEADGEFWLGEGGWTGFWLGVPRVPNSSENDPKLLKNDPNRY